MHLMMRLHLAPKRLKTIALVLVAVTIVGVLWSFKHSHCPSIVPCLVPLMNSIPGDVLELGASPYTTALLGHLQTYQRNITTVDTNAKMLAHYQGLAKSHAHKFQCPKSTTSPYVLQNIMYSMHPAKHDVHWNKVSARHFYGIVLVNQTPTQRRWKDVLRFRERAYAIVTPFDPATSAYNKVRYTSNMAKVVGTFKYACCVRRNLQEPVMVMSNFIDVNMTLAPLA